MYSEVTRDRRPSQHCRCGAPMHRVLAHWVCRKCGTVRVAWGRLAGLVAG